jgi:hypothetical protein
VFSCKREASKYACSSLVDSCAALLQHSNADLVATDEELLKTGGDFDDPGTLLDFVRSDGSSGSRFAIAAGANTPL